MNVEELRRHYNSWHGARTAADPTTDQYERRFLSWALELLSPREGEVVLDVACGQGTFLRLARSRGLRVLGVDLSEVALGHTRRALGSTATLGDGQALPLRDASCDHVTCLGSLEHFPSPAAGAREIARVLKRSGTALIFVPNLMFLGHVYFGVRHGIQPSEGGQQFSETFMTSRGWHELLEGAGLRVRATHPWNEIWASEKVSPLIMRTWNAVSQFVPLNGAYAFGFVCGRI